MRTLIATATAFAICAAGFGDAHAGRELTAEDIKKVVNLHAHEIQACYTKHALKQKSATGEVTLSMVVDKSGEVREDTIEVDAPGVRGNKFPRCVEDSVVGWEFPRTDGPTMVQYPFLFHHTKAPGAGPTS